MRKSNKFERLLEILIFFTKFAEKVYMQSKTEQPNTYFEFYLLIYLFVLPK